MLTEEQKDKLQKIRAEFDRGCRADMRSPGAMSKKFMQSYRDEEWKDFHSLIREWKEAYGSMPPGF